MTKEELSEIVTKGSKITGLNFEEQVILDIVNRYMEANITSGGAVEVHVSDQLADALGTWAADKLKALTRDDQGKVILTTSLTQAGFALNVTGETIELTESSVQAILMDMVGPSLRQLMSTPKQ